MNQKYLYLLLDVLSFLFPFLFSFYPKSNFSRKWKYLAPAILIPAVLFIAWDEWFTQMGVWGFNARYVSGVYLLSMPVEEILFFLCIPYACVFTYEAINYLISKRLSRSTTNLITDVLVVGLFVFGLIYMDRWYTAVTFFATSVFLLLHRWWWKSLFIGKFYVAFLFILIPFFIVNGILTGTGIEEEVVWYNNAENMSIRIGTIPVEDIFYGLLLLLMNVSLFEFLQKKKGPEGPL